MYQGCRIGAILLMAGQGSRLGGEIPKQFLVLGKKRVYLHTLDVFYQTKIFDEIVLVCHPDWLNIVAPPSCTIVEGGKTRQESSYRGLKGFTQKPDIVVVHDAVRPFVSKEILLNNVSQAMKHGAVDTCIPSSDTLVYAPQGAMIERIPKREQYYRGQTPQTFHYDLLLEAHQATHTENASDDCLLVIERGRAVHIVLGDDRNFKLTTSFDIKLAEFLLNN
jgi:2-C-methyl-D-erythritol 4-phosphate cytidylyltransferase